MKSSKVDNLDKCIENCVEFLAGSKTATCTFSSKAWITKVKKLAEKFPDKVKIQAENLDGSIVVHMPLTCFSLKSPREKKELSEEQRKVIGERLKSGRANDKAGRTTKNTKKNK